MPASTLDFWDDLLEYIDDNRVIPIVGRELLRVQYNGQDLSLHRLLAIKLAERLDLTLPPDDEDGDALNAVISAYIHRERRREDIYPRIRSIFKELTLPTPEPLRQLASIRHFNLFVTTTFDSLLEQAINQVRFAGAKKTNVLAYSPNDKTDLPVPVSQLDRPMVFHLLGKLSPAPNYAITEEDTLEFLYAMQSEKHRPERLLEELSNHHLLLIGNEFPDWLARFFIRLAKGGRLSGQRDSSEMIVDRVVSKEKSLVLFLQNFSYHTRVFPEASATQFVAELEKRYLARHPLTDLDKSRPGGGAQEKIVISDDEKPMPGAVFLSYASEDRPAAIKIRDALDSFGIDVWFDRKRLESGDDYTHKIRQNIKTCSLFLPLISDHTQTRLEGYFRGEWKMAEERALQIDDTVPFILPIAIDDTPEDEFVGSRKFTQVQWTRMKDGEVTPDFASRVVKLVRDYRRRERGIA